MPDLTELIRERVRTEGPLSLATFVEIALYTPELGYYRREQPRVGRSKDRDFYTAQSLGAVFNELLLAALLDVLGEPPSNYQLVELGAEGPDGLEGAEARFADYRRVGCADALVLEGPCVLFANELLDAQPFTRYRFEQGRWCERRITLEGEALAWISVEAETLPPDLPSQTLEGYTLDWPSGAMELLERILAQPWHGPLVFLDYGRSLEELLLNFPEGTGRAYYRHSLVDDLLARPGEQDLTCSLCWDSLEDSLRKAGCQNIRLQRQEAFFIQHAAGAVEAAMSRSLEARQTLKELLHPAHMGGRFEVLQAVKPAQP